jgi:two-component system sensor histidine kinase KdpD
VRGVLAVAPVNGDEEAVRAQQPLLGALASLAGIAVERLDYAEEAQRLQLETAAERMKTSVLSALSHDLRTPLTALVGMADSLALAREPLPEPVRETAVALRDQARTMSDLVANLLDMARLQAGRITLRREWQPIEEVIGPAGRLLAGRLAEHPLRVHLQPDLPLVAFDAVLLERVFCNLIENAAKHSPAGSAIDIDARSENGSLAVTVADRGSGFPPGPQEAIFEMFVRGDTGTATPGVGLGLAICRAIVEAHGGTIAARNRDGGGAEIRFTLPLGTPPTVEDETP